ncbi:hypothetical protein F5884DRAFT_804355 [Xylogone sp. PMI_703]|nr:hypothetical protein F5884DRAFT_804355 [Xylogone sp. PMI_703]
MRPRISSRRILFLRPLRPPNAPRPFTYNTLSRSRPQLPFLSSTARRPPARFLTTERKQWIKNEVWRAGKYTTVLWTSTVLLLLIAFGVQQEYLERRFPSPHEWSWITRKNYRSAKWSEDEDGKPHVDWARTGDYYRHLLKRLEDPKIDGAGLQEQADGGILVDGVGRAGFDITKKPESWRRGYYEVIMGAARAAEHLDSWVRDKTRNMAFPRAVVIGPSNPNPQPVPPGAHSAPREEDCEPAFDPPETFYMRILTTNGFTEKQRIDAALSYAAWLDFKNSPKTAEEMYKWALDISKSSTKESIVNSSTGVLNPDAGTPSANMLTAATALAVHHAVNSNIAAALPILVSVLRARKSLPQLPSHTTSSQSGQDEKMSLWGLFAKVKAIVTPPKYPPPPSDGTTPPVRDAKERCEEAGVMTYIGEILYASNSDRRSRDDGLAWTREAVDVAEEELRSKSIDEDAKKVCRQCLEVGLSNWNTMVKKLADSEKVGKAKQAAAGSWFSFGSTDQKDHIGRWESEELVVQERIRRARGLLGPSRPMIGGSKGPPVSI